MVRYIHQGKLSGDRVEAGKPRLGFLLTEDALGLIRSDLQTDMSFIGSIYTPRKDLWGRCLGGVIGTLKDLDSYLPRMPWDSLGQVPNGHGFYWMDIYTQQRSLRNGTSNGLRLTKMSCGSLGQAPNRNCSCMGRM